MKTMALSVMHLHSPVSHVVIRPAVHVSSHDSLTLVSQTLRSNNVSAALVGPDRTAIVTERDLTRALAAEYPADMPVVRVATPLPITVPADTDILEAAALMLNQDVRHLIVDLEDGSAGIVSMRDIMAVLLQAAKPDLWLSSLRLRVEIPSETWLG
jgi:signal-transduction protein with cAMP-binding, CBS, and nucleotidyltransferase domain